MPYVVEILSVGQDLYEDIAEAAGLLNSVQTEFQFNLPPERLRVNGLPFSRKEYYTKNVFDFLRDYRIAAKGHRPYLIAVLNGMLRSDKRGNLFGSHEASEGLAVVTLHDQEKYVSSRISFLCYYFIRYSLSFVAPELKVHEDTRACFFDEKRYKPDLLASLYKGDLCDDCRSKLQDNFNPEIYDAITRMIGELRATLPNDPIKADAESELIKTPVASLTKEDLRKEELTKQELTKEELTKEELTRPKFKWKTSYAIVISFVVLGGIIIGILLWRSPKPLPPALNDDSFYERQEEANKGVIIFVHGVLGDSKSTWTNPQTNAFWPTLLTKDKTFDGFDVYVCGFPSPALNKSYSIDELAEHLRLYLKQDGVLDHEEIIFLVHSMGGLVTRALLNKYRDIPGKVKFIYFFSTPTTGSQIAAIGKLISKNPQLGQMISMKSEDYLADEQRHWLAADYGIPSYCAYEILDTFGEKIVEQQSASNLCTKRLDPIDANHLDIVKPGNARAKPYLVFKSAFMEIYPPKKVKNENTNASAR